ncbi:MAG: hypothetical protein ACPGLV_06845 [Bacteroidia bacterium]
MRKLSLIFALFVIYAFAPPAGYVTWQTITEDDFINGQQVFYNYGLYLDNDAINFQASNSLNFNLKITTSSIYQNEGVALNVSDFFIENQTPNSQPYNYTLKLVGANSGNLQSESSTEISYDALDQTQPDPISQKSKDVEYLIVDQDGKKKGKIIVRISTSKKLLD